MEAPQHILGPVGLTSAISLRQPLRWWLLLLLALAAIGAGCVQTPPQRYEFRRVLMGVQTQIILHAEAREEARDAAAAAFAEIARLEQLMSDYRPSSQLSAINAAAGASVPADSSMIEILESASEVSRLTEGAFDATVGPAVLLWRESRRSGAPSSAAVVAEAVSLVDWRGVQVSREAGTVRLARRGMKLDLGGIAKGFAAEKALETLRARGMASALVALSGDVAVGDPPPGKGGWRVAIANERSGTILGTVMVANVCVSTSGDSEQFVEIAGVRYAHIADPRTAMGVVGGVPVTVIAPRGADADSIATGAFVLGSARTRTLALPAGVTIILHGSGEPEFFGEGGRAELGWTPRLVGGAGP